VFSSIVTRVSGIGGGKNFGRLGGKTLSYYVLTSLFAILIGLVLTNLIRPGDGVTIGEAIEFDHSSLQTTASPAGIFIRMIPLNPIKAASSGDILGIIFLSRIFGLALTRIQSKYGDSLRHFFVAIFEAMMKITEMVIKLAPLGIIGLMTKAVATSDYDLFATVGLYMVTVLSGLTIHLIIVLPLIFFLATRLNPLQHYRAIAPAMATAFSTSSSNATLPVTMRNIKQNVGVSNQISSFVLPLGTTINMDGTAL